jgi:hypothetical protein
MRDVGLNPDHVLQDEPIENSVMRAFALTSDITGVALSENVLDPRFLAGQAGQSDLHLRTARADQLERYARAVGPGPDRGAFVGAVVLGEVDLLQGAGFVFAAIGPVAISATTLPPSHVYCEASGAA